MKSPLLGSMDASEMTNVNQEAIEMEKSKIVLDKKHTNKSKKKNQNKGGL